MSLFTSAAAMTNKAVIPLFGLPVVGPALGRSMTVVTYTGRRSGATFRLPVAYRHGTATSEGGAPRDTVLIGVALPDKKKWWRNFTGNGGPLSLLLDGAERTGHAVATRDEKSSVSVRVVLDPVG
ncbi:hypothetical protein [Gordonia polyisoprenivorans]|uniref:hypothetical protein n=1 Tax=Gordonia polyisoprenivorans TaxID=84595 RepID=UPI000B99EA59|nr:hypothetical protein [Gordonia polyisoprenivorans]OZC30562.1 hypothetical protein CJJ17_03095 [Gordonia polyisoprenivorans]